CLLRDSGKDTVGTGADNTGGEVVDTVPAAAAAGPGGTHPRLAPDPPAGAASRAGAGEPWGGCPGPWPPGPAGHRQNGGRADGPLGASLAHRMAARPSRLPRTGRHQP